jgi:hypothetical protein
VTWSCRTRVQVPVVLLVNVSECKEEGTVSCAVEVMIIVPQPSCGLKFAVRCWTNHLAILCLHCLIYKTGMSWVWQYTPVIPEPWGLRQENYRLHCEAFSQGKQKEMTILAVLTYSLKCTHSLPTALGLKWLLGAVWL